MSMEYFECGCNSQDHLLRAYFDKDDDRKEPLDLIGLDFILRIGPDWMGGWWNRIKWRVQTALKILVGIEVEVNETWEIPLGMDDERVKGLAEFLLKAVREKAMSNRMRQKSKNGMKEAKNVLEVRDKDGIILFALDSELSVVSISVLD